MKLLIDFELMAMMWMMIILHLVLLTVAAPSPLPSSVVDTALCRPEERDALLSFKAAFSIDNSSHSDNCGNTSYAKTESWEKNGDCCKWDGVMCDSRTGHVVDLDLFCSQLRGSLPSNTTLFRLSRLHYLNLNGNFLSGQIPHEIGWLSHLTDLDLSHNEQLTMPNFQTIIANLTNLSNLDLSGVSIATNLPPFLFNFSQLQQLYLDNCGLEGEFPVADVNTSTLPLVDTIYLSNNKLMGNIPGWLFTHTSLSFLILSNNLFTGLSEFEVGNASSLTSFDASSNLLQGKIPYNIFKLYDLQYLDLSRNNLRGTIPLHTPQYISLLLLSHNLLQGAIPLSLCDSSALLILDLANNNLTSKIPDCFASLINTEMAILDLSANQLQGAIPSSLFQECPFLLTLSLSDNKLKGPIPRSMNNCSRMQFLDLSSNSLNDTFPHWLGILPSLEVLMLGSNDLQGSIEVSKDANSFRMLQILDISHNGFTGSLPVDLLMSMKEMVKVNNTLSDQYIGDDESYYNIEEPIVAWIKGNIRKLDKIYNELVLIDASKNRFEGPIPDVIGDLVSLRELNLAHNKFTGRIPPSLSNLSVLESLDLSFNILEGRIPTELVNLNSLAFFNVSENQLVGPVPTGKQFDTFLDPSYLGNPSLCGPLLTNKCEHTGDALPNSTTFEEQIDESSGLQVWEIGLMGCASGMIAGLAWGYFIFWKITPIWVERLIFQIEALINLSLCTSGGDAKTKKEEPRNATHELIEFKK